MIGASERRETAKAIAAIQAPDGSIAWEAGRHVDPWNMIEAAMGLDVCGMHTEARRAFGWLRDRQSPDGSWAAAYLDGRVVDPTVDANFCCYIATGCWFHFMRTDDAAWLRKMWGVVERALDHVLDMQLPSGAVAWARDAQGRLWPEALVSSSSSIFHSLWCGITIAEHLGEERPDWELSAATLRAAVDHHLGPFMDKDGFSMDHYYPVLTGVVRSPQTADDLDRTWARFVIEGAGCRCTDDRPWVTTGETSELAIALVLAGDQDRAARLIEWIQQLRNPDGLYWTGANHPGREIWPQEATSWSAGAALLAVDALEGGPTADLFSGRALAPRPDFEVSDAGERA